MKYRRLIQYSIPIRRRWVPILATVILLVTFICIGIFYYYWYKAFPSQERPLGTYLYIVFGLASVLSLILSICILKEIKKKAFSESLALLSRFIKIFEDALVSKNDVKISLLHFVPCPGLFDEIYCREPMFLTFRSLIHEVRKRNNITIRVAMLGEDGRRKFLREFFNYEKGKISEDDLHRGGNIEEYVEVANTFIIEAFETPTSTNIIKHYVDAEWLDEALNGRQFIILGGADRVGFIGSVSFVGGNFQLSAADYEGRTEVIHALYEYLASAYE